MVVRQVELKAMARRAEARFLQYSQIARTAISSCQSFTVAL
jgi:hypothetical protein